MKRNQPNTLSASDVNSCQKDSFPLPDIRKTVFILAALLISLSLFIPLYSYSSIEYELIQPDELYIGTPFILQATVYTDIGKEIHHPQKDTIGVFSVLNINEQTITSSDQKKSEDPLPEGRKKTIFSYQLAGFDTGQQKIPPLLFEIFDDKSGQTDTVSTPSLYISIDSVLSDSLSAIKDIAPPLKVWLKFWDVFLPLIVTALIVATTIFIVKRLKKPLGDPLSEIETDSRPPYQRALELLERLRNRKLLEKGENIEYHYQLSLILRFFLELHYKINAVEMTTSEIRASIKSYNLLNNDAESQSSVKSDSEILELLAYSDLVKFAKYTPDINRSLQYISWLEKYLRSFAFEHSKDTINQT